MNEDDLARRRALFELTDEDLSRLRRLRPLAEKHTTQVVEDFYKLLLSHEETRVFFPDEPTIRRVKRTQGQYFLELFDGRCDLAYVQNRLRVGATHDRIGVQPRWYLAAYSCFLRLIHAHLLRDLGDTAEASAAFDSLQKLVHFDMALAIDAYVASNSDAISRHQAAIRELSTPVIRVYHRVLLLPLIGAIDSQRAEQVMETVLTRVIEEQAKVIILDIAGVSVVDTKVADHLIKTTAAVRLLGAETILTGISAHVARTIVQLGVEIATMHTRSRLADGIELALSLVGKGIAPLEGTAPAARKEGA